MSRNATPEQREHAVALAAEVGVTEAAKQTGWSKGSISTWAKKAGVQTVQSERTAAAVEAIQLQAEERRARLADNLLEIAELGTDQTKRMLAEAGLRDVVGAWTRAIHDHQLLSGNPTGRVATQEERDQAMTEARERSLRLVASN